MGACAEWHGSGFGTGRDSTFKIAKLTNKLIAGLRLASRLRWRPPILKSLAAIVCPLQKR